jgi:hypothetical protein
MNGFTDQLTKEEQAIVHELRNIIKKSDRRVKEKTGDIMGMEKAYVYEEDGVFKYGLAKTSKHYSFHSMVMYTYPEIAELIKHEFSKAKLQKGCVNFKKLQDISPGSFEKMIKSSARLDFSPVIQRLKKKK